MKCPHCSKEIHISDWEETPVFFDLDTTQTGAQVVVGQCPACGNLIIRIQRGEIGGAEYPIVSKIKSDDVVYPMVAARFVEPWTFDKMGGTVSICGYGQHTRLNTVPATSVPEL